MKPLPQTASSSDGAAAALEIRLLRRLLKSVGNPPVTVVLWNGHKVESPEQPAIGKVTIHQRPTLWRLSADPLYEFGEAYAGGDLDIEGDLAEFMTVVLRLINRTPGSSVLRQALRWIHRPSSNTLAGSRENIHRHYDIGNDFYRLWLDEQLVYTSAYFPRRPMSLEQAQVAKMDHVCRKLDLRPGERVIEAGCGWGALALHMARNYGTRVKAYNISREQIWYARERAEREQLGDLVEFVEADWREIDDPCDAFISVGMLEHVGVRNYRQLGDVINRALLPHGRGLIHTIGQNYPQPFNPWIERRIFPGAYPPALREMMPIFETHQFSVLDVENLRLHYAETLRHWLARFEQASDQIRAMFDERFVRMWRLYLAGSVAGFAGGGNQLFQVVFARGTNNQIPWTREHLYGERDADSPPLFAHGETEPPAE